MWDKQAAENLTAAVAEMKKALTQATAYEDAMRVLDLVPLDVLKLIEEEFHYLWTPPHELRSRIAYAHLRRTVLRDVHEPLSEITARTVTEWAEGTLEEWLTGITDPDERGRQYRVKLMQDGTYLVETVRGDGARRFHVLVTVVEAT